MTNVNNFAIIGHLTADAEEFNIGNNTYVSFRVAVNRGQNKDASFIPVRAPKKFISDTLRAKLTKGASVLVSGRFESGHYEKDGQKKFYDYLSAATIQHDVNGGFSEGLLMGNLTADVVTRNTQNGGTMVTFTVASNRSYQKNGNWENATSYVSCAANGKTAEFIAAHFHKGDPIMLVGVLTSNQYQNKDGQNRTSYTVWVEKASFASRKNASQNDDVPAVTAAPTQAAPAAAPVAHAQAAPAAPLPPALSDAPPRIPLLPSQLPQPHQKPPLSAQKSPEPYPAPQTPLYQALQSLPALQLHLYP